MKEAYENHSIAPLVYVNQKTGRIRNFVVNVVNKTNMYRNSSLLVYNNNGESMPYRLFIPDNCSDKYLKFSVRFFFTTS